MTFSQTISKNNNLQQNNAYVKKYAAFCWFLPKKLIDHNFVWCATTKISLPIPLSSILMFIKLIWSKHKSINDKLQRENCWVIQNIQ
jgi:hypothetical protein